MLSPLHKSAGVVHMKDVLEADWLVEIFLRYQESLDKLRDTNGGKMVLKEALEVDRIERMRPYMSASAIDTI